MHNVGVSAPANGVDIELDISRGVDPGQYVVRMLQAPSGATMPSALVSCSRHTWLASSTR